MRTPTHQVTGHGAAREGARRASEYFIDRATEAFTGVENVLYVTSSAVLDLPETAAELRPPAPQPETVQRAGLVGLYDQVAEAHASAGA